MQRVGISGLLLVLVIVFGCPQAAWATETAVSPETGDSAQDEEAPDSERAVLYTISPGNEVFERWGHSLLCFQPAGAFAQEKATQAPESYEREELLDTSCFDFGIFPRLPLSRVVLGSLRGEALFVPQQLAYQDVAGRYWLLDRTVERQVLPFDQEQVFDLRDRLEQLVSEGQGYAYHPFTNNCSTQIRDVIDQASGGKLSRENAPRDRGSFRSIAESGFSDHAPALFGVELLVGSSADEPTTAFQQAAFPDGLKDLVADEMGVSQRTVYQQSWTALPTSVHAGRLIATLVALGLCGALWLSYRRDPSREGAWKKWANGIALGFAFVGALGLCLRFISDYPEFSSSWMPVVFFPLDAAMPWMGRSVCRRYLRIRMVGLVLLAILSVVGVVSQPLLIQTLLVGLPLGLILFIESQIQQEGASVQQDSADDDVRAAEGA